VALTMPLRIAIDTNCYRALTELGDADVAQTVQAAEAVYVPFVVLAELRSGFALGKRRGLNEHTLREFMATPRVQALWADEGTTYFYAVLYGDMRIAGTPISTNDLWIAALVVQHDLTLLTRDKHFERITRIRRI
jgi:tRNA(fMet)-specific endonuclease VapC